MLAPTGTIGFMMDCDTTGVEPDIALVKYKKLVGGGMMKIVNNTVPMALTKLGYTPAQVKDIIGYIDEHETIEGAPHLKDKDLPVFDCAFKADATGVRSIHYMGHIKMMGAVQPFISGAISKTVNVPKAATVEEIEQAYIDAWRIGAKAVSIYRDGSKRTQPLNTSRDKQAADAAAPVVAGPLRHRLPDERQSITHKFDIAGHEGYITVGLYEDGQPGELFLTMAKEGSTISGFADAFAQAISYALQYGVPLQDLVDKFSHVRFEPSGMTRNPDIRFAKSIVDYIFRWMAAKFLSAEAQYRAGVNNREEATTPEQLVLDVAASASTASASTKDAAATAASAAGAASAGQGSGREGVEVRGDSEPGRRAAVLDVRIDHGALGCLLQVQQLRHDERLRVGGGCREGAHAACESLAASPRRHRTRRWAPRCPPDGSGGGRAGAIEGGDAAVSPHRQSGQKHPDEERHHQSVPAHVERRQTDSRRVVSGHRRAKADHGVRRRQPRGQLRRLLQVQRRRIRPFRIARCGRHGANVPGAHLGAQHRGHWLVAASRHG